MSTPAPTIDPSTYIVTPPVPDTQFVQGLNQTVQGWRINVFDREVGNYVPVFVANSNYTPEGVTLAIDDALTTNRAVYNLGSRGTTTGA